MAAGTPGCADGSRFTPTWSGGSGDGIASRTPTSSFAMGHCRLRPILPGTSLKLMAMEPVACGAGGGQVSECASLRCEIGAGQVP